MPPATLTSSFAAGVAVPTPTSPLVAIVMCGNELFVPKINGWLLVVPIANEFVSVVLP